MNTLSSMDEQFIKNLVQVIEENLHDESFGTAELAAQLGISRVTLYRRVKSIVKKSVSEFIRETRLKRAYELLQNKTGTVSEIAYQVGFNNPGYFNKCFHEYYGVTPGDVLKGNHKPPKEKTKKKQKPAFSILYLLILAVVVITAGFLIYFQLPQKNSDDKITLIIPAFTDENPVEGINTLKTIRDDLHNKLYNVKELNVISPIFYETNQFKDTGIIETGKILVADYILTAEKSYDATNDAKIYFRLTDIKDGNVIWSKDFNDEKNTFGFCYEVAMSIVAELKIELTDEEIKIITKKPSDNPAALVLYESGLSELEQSTRGLGSLQEAKLHFISAVYKDSTMAEAYVQLAHIYLNFLAFLEKDRELKQSYRDSAKLMAEKALLYDNKNAWAYGMLAQCYRHSGDIKKSKKYSELSEKYSIHDASYYLGSVGRHHGSGEHFKAVESGLKHMQLAPQNALINRKTLELMWFNLTIMGFPDVGITYERMNVEQVPNQYWSDFFHLGYMVMHNWFTYNFKDAEIYLREKQKMDSTNLKIYSDFVFTALCQKKYDEAYQYMLKAMDVKSKINDTPTNPDLSFGFAYLEAGKKEEAMFHIDHYIKLFKEQIENNHPMSMENNIYLASIYAGLNKKETTFYYLNQLKKSESNFGWFRFGLINYRTFDKYRESREFQEIYNYVDKQYQKEHNKIKDLLIREGLLESL
jgi:AraC-like DNA-binding protein/TolB-like protein